jgi:hypothetical protein
MVCRLALIEPISAQRSGAIKAKAGTWIKNLPKVSLIKIGKNETFIKFVRITIKRVQK